MKAIIKYNACLIIDNDTIFKHKVVNRNQFKLLLKFIEEYDIELFIIEKPFIDNYVANIQFGYLISYLSDKNIIVLEQQKIRKLLFNTNKLSTDKLISEVRVRINVEYPAKQMLNLADCITMLLYISKIGDINMQNISCKGNEYDIA